MSKYWEVLQANGIDRKRLCSYERKITEEPYYLPNTIQDFENYLQILKQMHSSGDIQILCDEAHSHLGSPEHAAISDMMKNFNDHDTLRQMDRVTLLRTKLNTHHINQQQGHHKLKDIIFLDLALQQYMKTLADRIIHIDIGFNAQMREVNIILKNLAMSYRWDELAVCQQDFELALKLIDNLQSHDEAVILDSARKIKSITDRLRQVLGEVNDSFENNIQTKAELLGKRFGVEDYTMKLFSVELLRGSLFFSLSMILEKTELKLRAAAKLGDWLVISRGRSYGSRGWAVKEANLADVQLKTYDKRTVLIVDKITGEEEVPSNVQAIVLLSAATGSHPDVLAHVSVRARNLRVMLACVYDEAKCQELLRLEGKHIFLQPESENTVKFEE